MSSHYLNSHWLKWIYFVSFKDTPRRRVMYATGGYFYPLNSGNTVCHLVMSLIKWIYCCLVQRHASAQSYVRCGRPFYPLDSGNPVVECYHAVFFSLYQFSLIKMVIFQVRGASKYLCILFHWRVTSMPHSIAFLVLVLRLGVPTSSKFTSFRVSLTLKHSQLINYNIPCGDSTWLHPYIHMIAVKNTIVWWLPQNIKR